MELKEYIKQSYLRPNKQVLESLGASDELIEYLRTTPWNTNLNIVDSLSESGSESGIILFEDDCEFTKPAPTDWVMFHSYLVPKTQIFDILNAGDQVKVTIGENVSTGIITEEESDDGTTVTKYFNLEAPFDNCRIDWDKYGQKVNTDLYLLIVDELGTYHVKVEKI